MGLGFNFANNSKDRKLYESLAKEQVDLFGTDLEYWTVERDETKDKLYAEDTLPNITGRYDIKGYGQPIPEYFTLSKFGFQSPDVIEYIVSRKAFKDKVGEDKEPLWGDMVYIPYMDRVFQVNNVQHEANIFLGEKFSYKLVLGAADDSGAKVTSSDEFSVTDWNEQTDPLDDNEFIESADDSIVVDKTNDKNPFGDFE